jgi:hypothetical protein
MTLRNLKLKPSVTELPNKRLASYGTRSFVYKEPPLIHALAHIGPGHSPPAFKMHFSAILSSTSRLFAEESRVTAVRYNPIRLLGAVCDERSLWLGNWPRYNSVRKASQVFRGVEYRYSISSSNTTVNTKAGGGHSGRNGQLHKRWSLFIGLSRWYTAIAATILDIIHRPVLYFKHDISQSGFSFLLLCVLVVSPVRRQTSVVYIGSNGVGSIWKRRQTPT